MHWIEVDGAVIPQRIGGHPALDFCNTYAGWGESTGSDYLVDYDTLVVWARHAGLLASADARSLRRRGERARREAAAIVDEARDLRTAVHTVALDPSDREGLGQVSSLASRAATAGYLVPGSPPRWHIAGGLDRPLLATAWSAAELLTTADLSAVRSCPGAGCGWVFLDPRGRRRWCSMQWCGNRAKVRAHAERARKRRGA